MHMFVSSISSRLCSNLKRSAYMVVKHTDACRYIKTWIPSYVQIHACKHTQSTHTWQYDSNTAGSLVKGKKHRQD